MKRALLIIGIVTATLLAGSLHAQTAEFSPDRVGIDYNRQVVTYEGLDQIAIDRSTIFPMKAVFVELGEDENAGQINWRAITSQRLDEGWRLPLESDIATGQNNMYGYRPVSLAEQDRLGRSAVQVSSVFRSGGRRFAALMIMPVFLNDADQLCLAEEIEINIDGRLLTPGDLLDGIPDAHRSTPTPMMGSGEFGGISYLIVTDESLATPATRLARYKTVTGIASTVVFIDDVISAYSGRDDAEALREFLKDYYADGGRYVCLAGDETLLPVRYAYPNSTGTVPDTLKMQLCDLYFADLTGEWDVDNDNVWGERYIDEADIVPELIVGRLPFADSVTMSDYIDKVIMYETNPGHGQFDYLTRAFFFSSDQMRDYAGGGQHGRIASAYPTRFDIDTVQGVEIARGDDPDPTNAASTELESTMTEGHGIINVISHGMTTRFEVRTTGYNGSPRSYFTSDPDQTWQGQTGSFNGAGRVGLFYSLACNNGAFDLDIPGTPQNISVALLAAEDAGAVACIGYSRWGWVGSSYLLQTAFFDSLFANPDYSAAEAMYASKVRYAYYTDLVYGQNFLGDPTLRIYTDIPGQLTVTDVPGIDDLQVRVTSFGQPVSNARVLLSDSVGLIAETTTDPAGLATLDLGFAPGAEYWIAVSKPGYCQTVVEHTPSIVSDVDDDPFGLPRQFSLAQNYPNPFNPHTTIAFELSRRSEVTLDIFNILGEHIVTLIESDLAPGHHSVRFEAVDRNGRPLASGVYLYRLATSEITATRKMLLIR